MDNPDNARTGLQSGSQTRSQTRSQNKVLPFLAVLLLCAILVWSLIAARVFSVLGISKRALLALPPKVLFAHCDASIRDTDEEEASDGESGGESRFKDRNRSALRTGDLLFLCPQQMRVMRAYQALYGSALPHVVMYWGLDERGIARVVHLSSAGLRLGRLSTVLRSIAAGNTHVALRQLQCSDAEREALLEACAHAVRTQRSVRAIGAAQGVDGLHGMDGLGLESQERLKAQTSSRSESRSESRVQRRRGEDYSRPAFLARAARLVLGLRDDPSLGHVCSTAMLRLYFDAGILAQEPLGGGLWRPSDLLTTPAIDNPTSTTTAPPPPGFGIPFSDAAAIERNRLHLAWNPGSGLEAPVLVQAV